MTLASTYDQQNQPTYVRYLRIYLSFIVQCDTVVVHHMEKHLARRTAF